MERYDIFPSITDAVASTSYYESEIYTITDSGTVHFYVDYNDTHNEMEYKINDGNWTNLSVASEVHVPINLNDTLQFRGYTTTENSFISVSIWFEYDTKESIYTAFIIACPIVREESIGVENVKYWIPEASNPVLVVKESDSWVIKDLGATNTLTTNTAIVVCDYHNSSIKLIDTNYQVVQTIQLESKPFCLVDYTDHYNGYAYLLIATDSKIYQYYLNNGLLTLKNSRLFDNILYLSNINETYIVLTETSEITIDPISLRILNTKTNTNNYDCIDYNNIDGSSGKFKSIDGYCKQIAVPNTFLTVVPKYNIFNNSIISKTWDSIPVCMDVSYQNGMTVGHYSGQIVELSEYNIRKDFSVDCAIYDMTNSQGSTIGFGYSNRQDLSGILYALKYKEYKTDTALPSGTELFNDVVFVISATSSITSNTSYKDHIKTNYYGILNKNLINKRANTVISSISTQHDMQEFEQVSTPIMIGGYILYFTISTGAITLKLYFDPVIDAKIGVDCQSNVISVRAIGNPVNVASSRLTFYVNDIKQNQPVLISAFDNVQVTFKPNVYGATVINNIYSVTDTGINIEKVGEFQVTSEPIGGNPLPPSSSNNDPILIDNSFNRDVFWHSNFTVDADFYEFLKSTLYTVDISGFNVDYGDWLKGVIASNFTHLSFNSITSKAGTYVLESLTRAFFEDTYVIYKNFLSTYHFASFSQYLQILNQHKIDTSLVLDSNSTIYELLSSYKQDVNTKVYKITTSFIQVLNDAYSYFMEYELDKNSKTYTFENNAIYATLYHHYVDTRTNILTYFEQNFVNTQYVKSNTARQYFIQSILNVFDQAFYFYESVYIFNKTPNSFLIDVVQNKYTNVFNLSEYVDYIRQQSNTYLLDLNYEFFYPVVHEYGCNTACHVKGMFDNEEEALAYAREHYPEERILRAIEIDGCWTYLIKTNEGSGCPLPDVKYPYKGYIRGG